MFRFKQFTVEQHLCAMKVNTDGVLLGAWALSHTNNPKPVNALDIGTGTGVIALMVAQAVPCAKIDAIDIDENAATQAAQNFANSPWADKLQSIHIGLQELTGSGQYDVILSNPPYFIDDYKCGDNRRDLARHSTALTYTELLEGIAHLLAGKGKAYIIVPEFNVALIKEIAEGEELYITHTTHVIAVDGKKPYVTLLCLQWERSHEEVNTITIQNTTGEFTEQYRLLTKDFYLKF